MAVASLIPHHKPHSVVKSSSLSLSCSFSLSLSLHTPGTLVVVHSQWMFFQRLNGLNFDGTPTPICWTWHRRTVKWTLVHGCYRTGLLGGQRCYRLCTTSVFILCLSVTFVMYSFASLSPLSLLSYTYTHTHSLSPFILSPSLCPIYSLYNSIHLPYYKVAAIINNSSFVARQ